ncbi:helix-turn-helix transcriptional regulator [Thiothrix fructosivorans]|uniref:Helix-turn-helix transcriptional regulator n=1 Tax=Thiothrix fructosivorans TaxID=111770 RepID=A0A8B0SK54_9GAMM|nr:helix-turn-helix transcriptional regulator [Thiothrix fructosivorans]QTX12613.1 helix-turn-helix transcriptional regulator [Thiothrix fructosivorans]
MDSLPWLILPVLLPLPALALPCPLYRKGWGCDQLRQYSEVIQEQLTTWEFTPSEKEIALLLLKGLSFEEIAGIRDAKEKTVRQQATAIYRKSGLNGRHEFAAWFFEDFLH